MPLREEDKEGEEAILASEDIPKNVFMLPILKCKTESFLQACSSEIGHQIAMPFANQALGEEE